MVRSMYAAIAGLRAHQSKMDVIGNNIANVNTPGYKTARATFQESIYQTSAQSTGANDTFGGTNAMQVGYGSKLGAIDLVFATSNLSPTGQATDCMIDGDGFFLVGQKFKHDPVTRIDGAVAVTSDGQIWDSDAQSALKAAAAADVAADISQLNFSRVGDFKLDNDGYLVDKNGNCVYGYAMKLGTDGTPSADPPVMDMTKLQPIKVPLLKEGTSTTAELPSWGNVSIDAKGNVTCTLGKDNKPYTLGRVAVAIVPNPGGLEHTDGPYYQLGGNAGTARAYTPQSASAGKLVTGGLEAANVDLANEFSEMITTQRGFQANSRIITVTDQMLEELVNLKR